MSERPEGPYLIAGLGNAGRAYRENRHNVGFMLVDHLAQDLGRPFSRIQFDALTTDARLDGRRLILAKPQLLMNRSGRPVAALARYYRVPEAHVLVAYDDLDQPVGQIRFRPAGGSGGHRGMADILDRMGHQELARLRIGIGRPAGRMDPADYVLQDFSSDERELIESTISRAADCVRSFVLQGIEQAMNECNERISG